MLLDELITVIETLKQRITDHGAILRDNETRSRMALIDPLLQVPRLGYNRSLSRHSRVRCRWRPG